MKVSALASRLPGIRERIEVLQALATRMEQTLEVNPPWAATPSPASP